MPYPGQLIHHLLLFGGKLHLIGEYLPFAAATVAVVLAHRLKAVGRWFHQPLEVTFHISLAHAGNLHIHHIPGHCLRHKQNLAVYVCKAVAFGRNGFYQYILKQWLIFFPCHNQ